RFVECITDLYPLGQNVSEEERQHNEERLRRVLSGDGEGLDEELQRRQEAHLRAPSPHRAAHVQGQRTALERALRSMQRFETARHTDALLVYPARRPGRAAVW